MLFIKLFWYFTTWQHFAFFSTSAFYLILTFHFLYVLSSTSLDTVGAKKKDMVLSNTRHTHNYINVDEGQVCLDRNKSFLEGEIILLILFWVKLIKNYVFELDRKSDRHPHRCLNCFDGDKWPTQLCFLCRLKLRNEHEHEEENQRIKIWHKIQLKASHHKHWQCCNAQHMPVLLLISSWLDKPYVVNNYNVSHTPFSYQWLIRSVFTLKREKHGWGRQRICLNLWS